VVKTDINLSKSTEELVFKSTSVS